MKKRTPSVTDKGNKTGKRTKRKNQNYVKTSAHERCPRSQGKKRNRIITRNILSLIVLTTLASGVSLNAEPPSTDRTSNKNANKVESPKPQAKTNAAPKIIPAPPLAEGWSYVKGEWIHSDGYKYVNGQVIRTGAQTHKRPPKPPAKWLLDSVKTKPKPTPDPNSAAAKAAERERNLRPRPAPQTGTNL